MQVSSLAPVSVASQGYPQRTAKPSIRSVMEREGIELRGNGANLIGKCSLHDDRVPSLSVNDQKGLFFCHGCGAKGDVIDFVRQSKGLSYKEALTDLGMSSGHATGVKRREDPLLQQAREVAKWSNVMTVKVSAKLREVEQQIHFAIERKDADLWRSFADERTILEILAEDLQDAKSALELYRERDAVENILADSDVSTSDLPALTAEYRQRLTEGVEILAPFFQQIYPVRVA